MSNRKNCFIRLMAMTMAFVMVIGLAGCNVTQQSDGSDKASATYTVTVQNRAGTLMDKCMVEIYADENLTEQVYRGITNAQGSVSFTAEVSDEYRAVISRQPTGYAVEKSYRLVGESTTVVLVPGQLTEQDMDTITFSLGDVMMDFTVTGSNGENVSISQLLQDKKAVVLNFWYLNCQPCKLEFPHIQEAYEQMSQDVALLALNPCDGTNAQIEAFRVDNGYTFTMAKCDSRWERMLSIPSYPTTVIIDRYGNICLIHNGMIKTAEEFTAMVNYFVSDDYKQTFFKNAGEIPAIAKI